MVTAMPWTLSALTGAGLVACFVDARAGRRHLGTGPRTALRTEMGALRTEIRGDIDGLRDQVRLPAERRAEMNGRLEVVAAQAHTHPTPGPQG